VRRANRTCKGCGGPIPDNRRGHAEFCAESCYRRFLACDPARRAQQRDWNLQRKYGIGAAEVDALIEAQGGGCGICGTTEWNGKDGLPHVDHDHDSGRIRGVLCDSCNNGLGRFRDDPNRLRAAADYLERR
jgi:hypothetical protein